MYVEHILAGTCSLTLICGIIKYLGYSKLA